MLYKIIGLIGVLIGMLIGMLIGSIIKSEWNKSYGICVAVRCANIDLAQTAKPPSSSDPRR